MAYWVCSVAQKGHPIRSNIEDNRLTPHIPNFFEYVIRAILLFIVIFLVYIMLFPCSSSAERRKRDTGSVHQDPNSESSGQKEEITISSQEQRPLGYYEYKFYKSFGGSGLGYGYFEYPVDIDTDPDDNIYVCDKEAGRIQSFDPEGNFKEEWYMFDIDDLSSFKQSNKMDNPEALCVDYKERIGEIFIYVTDTKNNRILQFNMDGKLIDPEGRQIEEDPNLWIIMKNNNLMWGEFGSRQGSFHHPTDIAVDGHDNCYILDSKNSRIQCFDDEGKFKHEWGGFGSGPGSFLKPSRMAYDQSGFGSIWVIDSKDGRLHQFDLQGNFLRAVVPKDKDQKALPRPTDFCFDSQGFIYLTDASLNKVFKYNNDLDFIQCWGEEGQGPGQFKGISGIVVDKEDRVLVVDSGNCRIQIFRHF